MKEHLYDHSQDETPTALHPASMLPAENICAPVLTERARRKAVDAEFGRRLNRIEKRVNVVLAALAFMVGAATLEYAGLIGKNAEHTVWSHAIFDGVKFAVLGK